MLEGAFLRELWLGIDSHCTGKFPPKTIGVKHVADMPYHTWKKRWLAITLLGLLTKDIFNGVGDISILQGKLLFTRKQRIYQSVTSTLRHTFRW